MKWILEIKKKYTTISIYYPVMDRMQFATYFDIQLTKILSHDAWLDFFFSGTSWHILGKTYFWFSWTVYLLCKLEKWCHLDWVLWAIHSRRQVNSCIFHCMCIYRTKPLFFLCCEFFILLLSVKGKWCISQEGIG